MGTSSTWNFQSENDPDMPLRMAEYCLGVGRLFGKFPRQIVLYVGEAPMAMNNDLRGPKMLFRYSPIDIRELDGDRLLESEETGDNVIAILARLRGGIGRGGCRILDVASVEDLLR